MDDWYRRHPSLVENEPVATDDDDEDDLDDDLDDDPDDEGDVVDQGIERWSCLTTVFI